MGLEQSKLYDTLITCLKKNDAGKSDAALSALSNESWNDLLELSIMQRIISFLWHRLKQKALDKFVPDETAKIFREAFIRNTMKNMRFNGELYLLLSRLNSENIPLILLKGIALANNIYENVGLREMNDIDILTRQKDLLRVVDILTGNGYKPMNTINVNTTIQASHHLPGFIKKGHAKIEIHWNITHPNKNYSIDPHGLWARAVPIQIYGCNTLMLSPEDLLLHICLHTSYQHPFTFGLRPFCDITEIIEHFGSTLDWQAIMERAISQHWQKGVYLTLYLAGELAGASVPDYIMKKLKPTDISTKILETARDQIFTEKYFASSIPAPFVQLLKSKSFSDKIKIFWHRVFLPKALIANAYPVPLDSPRIYVYYLRRFYDVLRRHGRTLKRFHNNDPAVKSLIDRKKIIADWMDQE